MVNDGTESVDLVRCKNCMHCVKMEIETWDDSMSGVFSEWMCECYDGSYHPESDNSECPEYVEDRTRIAVIVND